MRRVLNLIVPVLISIMLVLALTACGAKTEQDGVDESESTEQTEITEEPSSEEPEEFDIGANMKVTENDDEKIIETDYLIIKAPRGSTWDCKKVDNNYLQVYNIAAHESGYQGEILHCHSLDVNDNSYEDWGSVVIGVKGDRRFLANWWLAGAAQYDPYDEQIEEDYNAVAQEISIELK